MNRKDCFPNPHLVTMDLDDGTVRHSGLTQDMIHMVGGAAVNSLLLDAYRHRHPLVLGTGPLTGGFAPASCLMAVSFFPNETECRHVPVVMKSGPMLKFCGIDFVVFLGRSPVPCVVIIEKDRIRIDSARDLAGLSIPEIVRRLTSTRPLGRELVLVTGPGAQGLDHSTGTSVFGGFERCGLSKVLAAKNILAVVLGRGGSIPIYPGTIEMGLELAQQIHNQLPRQRFKAILGRIPGSGPALALVKKYFRQSHACYHCPVGCINHLQYPAAYKTQNTGKEQGKGVFILDHEGFARLAEKRPKDAHILMGRAMALGLNPVAVAGRLNSGNFLNQTLTEMETLSMDEKNNSLAREDAHQELCGISAKVYHRFGGGLPIILPQNTNGFPGTWEERVAFAMTVGVCPIPLLLTDIPPASFVRFIPLGPETQESLNLRLENSVKGLL
jgi:hypothetical protein